MKNQLRLVTGSVGVTSVGKLEDVGSVDSSLAVVLGLGIGMALSVVSLG